jgi:hypothetical protein
MPEIEIRVTNRGYRDNVLLFEDTYTVTPTQLLRGASGFDERMAKLSTVPANRLVVEFLDEENPAKRFLNIDLSQPGSMRFQPNGEPL